MGHVARAPWNMLRGLHGTCCEGSMERCEGSMGHVARAPWDMLQGFHGHVARALWDMLRHVTRLHVTCCKVSIFA